MTEISCLGELSLYSHWCHEVTIFWAVWFYINHKNSVEEWNVTEICTYVVMILLQYQINNIILILILVVYHQ